MKRIVVIILLVPVVLFLLVSVGSLIGYKSEERAKAARSVNPKAAEAMARPLLDYASAHDDGRLPDAKNWFEVARSGANITSRQLPRKPFVVMAMNDGLSGVRISDLEFPYQTVLLFECIADGPDFGGPELLPAVSAGSRGYMIVFASGHLEVVSSPESLFWEPIARKPDPITPAEQEEIEAARARAFWDARPQSAPPDSPR